MASGRGRILEHGRHPDLVMLGVGGVSLLTYALHGFDSLLSRDLGIYAYAGQQFVDGVPPFEAVLNRAGPLAHALPGIGVLAARLGGFDDLLGMRVLYLLFAVASVCLTYALGRELFRSKAAGLVSATAFLTFQGLIVYASGGPREKTPMLLLLLWSALAVHRKHWFAAGVTLSLATLVLQLAFPVGLVIALTGLIAVRRGERLRSVVRYLVGGTVPVVLCLVYFGAAGTLRSAVSAFVTINAKYTVPNPITKGFATNWRQLHGGYGASLWVMFVGLAVLILLSVWGCHELVKARRQHARTDTTWVSLIGVTLAALVAIAWMLRDFDDWPDAMTVLPWAAIGCGGLLRVLARFLTPTRVLAVALVCVLACVSMALTFSLGNRDHRLTVQRQSVAAKMAALPPHASILSINSPQPLVLTGQTNPTRFQTFSSGLGQYVDDTWPGGLHGFVNWIDRQHPTVITVGPPRPRWLRSTLQSEYKRVGSAPGWVWYARKSLGPTTLAAVKNAR